MARVDWPTEIGTLDKGRRLQGRTDSWRQQVAWRWQRMARKSRRKDSEGTQRFPSGSVAVQRVVLVGGATRMPAIGRFIRRRSDYRRIVIATSHARVSPRAALVGGVEEFDAPLEHARGGRGAAVEVEVRQRLERWRGKEELALEDQMQRRAATAGSDDLQQQADALLCLPSPSREQVEQAQKL